MRNRLNASQKRVHAGMALLDKQVPGWENKINLKKLDIESSRRCVLGQLFGDYAYGCSQLTVVSKKWDFFPSAHGFLYPEDTETWVREITLRRESVYNKIPMWSETHQPVLTRKSLVLVA